MVSTSLHCADTGHRTDMTAPTQNTRQQGKPMLMWIAIAAAVFLVLLGLLHRKKSDKEAAAQSAHYASLQNQKQYTATVFPCTVQFPSGFAHKVTAYDPFLFRGRRAELATCNDATDGEVWAEFYARPSSDDAKAFLQEAFADETHRLVRQRLAFLFDFPLPTEADKLHGKFQVLTEGTRDGWQVRLTYLPTPHGAGLVSPYRVPRAELRPDDIIAELPMFGIPSNNLSPWIWVGVDDFRNQAERDSYRRAERHALEKLKDQQREYQKARDRFQRMHRHFYVVEAAKQLAPQQVVVLRRFGSIIEQKTPHSAAEIIAQMMSSLRCESAAPRP